MPEKNTIMNTNTHHNPFTKPINILLLSMLCTALWGSAFPCVKIGYQLFSIAAEDTSGKLVFAGIRFFFAGIITLIISTVQNRKIPLLRPHNVKGVLIVSLVQTVLQYQCQ